jgi:hypothetical protein
MLTPYERARIALLVGGARGSAADEGETMATHADKSIRQIAEALSAAQINGLWKLYKGERVNRTTVRALRARYLVEVDSDALSHEGNIAWSKLFATAEWNNPHLEG